MVAPRVRSHSTSASRGPSGWRSRWMRFLTVLESGFCQKSSVIESVMTVAAGSPGKSSSASLPLSTLAQKVARVYGSWVSKVTVRTVEVIRPTVPQTAAVRYRISRLGEGLLLAAQALDLAFHRVAGGQVREPPGQGHPLRSTGVEDVAG